MLHMGFLPDIEKLISGTDGKRQLLMFSATIPDKIRNLAKAYMQKPTSVTVQGENITLDTIEQKVYMMEEQDKVNRLVAMLESDNPYLAIVFCNTKEGAIKLAYDLARKGVELGEIHGDMTQGRRTQVLKEFAKGNPPILVATDIAARGIDIEGVSHVYNFDVPHDMDYYIHRIGRTGRAGSTGIAVTFATPAEEVWVRRIERSIQATLTKYTKDGQVKTKGSGLAPKKETASKKPKIKSTYQATKAKAHKARGHKGANTRVRRAKSSGTSGRSRGK